jgi:hypothetical protein
MEKSSAKRNSGRKSALIEIDRRKLRRIVSKNQRNTAAQVRAKLNIHTYDPLSRRTVLRELHKSIIHGRAETAKLLITGSNAQMRKRWCHGHKPGHKKTGKTLMI